jgi:hypothetical protein
MTTDKPRWPVGHRILLWAAGSILVVLIIVAILFVLNTAR